MNTVLTKLAQAALPPPGALPPGLPPMGAPATDPATGMPTGMVPPGLPPMGMDPNAGMPMGSGQMQAPAPMGLPPMGMPPSGVPVDPAMAGTQIDPMTGMPLGMPPGPPPGMPAGGEVPPGDVSGIVPGVDPNLDPATQAAIAQEAGSTADPAEGRKVDNLANQMTDVSKQVSNIGKSVEAIAEYLNIGKGSDQEQGSGTEGDDTAESSMKIASAQDFSDALRTAAGLREHAANTILDIFDNPSQLLVKQASLRTTIEKAARSRALRNVGRVAKGIRSQKQAGAELEVTEDMLKEAGYKAENVMADFSMVSPETFSKADGLYSKIASDIDELRKDPVFVRVIFNSDMGKVASAEGDAVDVDHLMLDLVELAKEATGECNYKMAADCMEAYASLTLADELESLAAEQVPVQVQPE